MLMSQTNMGKEVNMEKVKWIAPAFAGTDEPNPD